MFSIPALSCSTNVSFLTCMQGSTVTTPEWSHVPHSVLSLIRLLADDSVLGGAAIYFSRVLERQCLERARVHTQFSMIGGILIGRDNQCQDECAEAERSPCV